MTLLSRNMMSDSGDHWNFKGEPVKAAGFYGISSDKHTISISVHDFVGRIYLYGTLEDTPELADKNDGWILIRNAMPEVNQCIFEFTSNGDTAQYALNVPGDTDDTFVTYDGITQARHDTFTYEDGMLKLMFEGEARSPCNGVKIRIRVLLSNNDGDVYGDVFHAEFTTNKKNTFPLYRDKLKNQNISCTQVILDGIIQIPHIDYTINDGILSFTQAPPCSSYPNIHVSVYPPMDLSKPIDYFVQFPLHITDPDIRNGLPSPIYGPRTTGTVLGTVRGKYTYIKAELNRDYLEPEEPTVQYKKDAVGSLCQILVNF